MTNLSFKIGHRIIGENHPCFIVAEMSGNHNHDIKNAYSIIDAAAEAGVDALKMQTYTPDTITLNSDKKWFRIKSDNQWGGQTLYQLYEKAYTPWEWQKKLKEYGEKKGLLVFSTPFDITSVDFLENLDVPLYKISSFEIVHIPLLKKVGQTRKPVFISRGLATPSEINQAIKTLKSAGCPKIVLLHCVSSYPATLAQMNVATMFDMRTRFNTLVGLSDHSLGPIAAITAVAEGACVIEKHLTLSRKDGGPDAAFSLEPAEFAILVKTIREVETAIGKVRYAPDKKEQKFLMYKPSLFAAAAIKQGEKFTPDNLRVVRPGFGLAPKYYEQVLGKTAKKDIKQGTPLTWNMIAK